ncbi:phosphocholine-specific phospholipase C [Frateuria aurantia]
MPLDRRRFLQLSATAASTPLWPASIAKALGIAPATVNGTLEDVQHVVILMQENRAFDHYFGSLRGVRGFGDPRPLTLRNGKPVWQQPRNPGSDDTLLPFHLDSRLTGAQCMDDLNHDWKASHDIWKDHDAWVTRKTPMTMGHFTREDLPFYYALADAFTICDGYHASIFGPTNPNRLFLFSGSSGLSVGQHGPYAVNNVDDGNWTADMSRDNPSYQGLGWTTYAERLEQAGVSWKLYQEYDNFGDNALQSFARFRNLPLDAPLYRKGRAWAEGSTPENAATTLGEPLVRAFNRDLDRGELPQVSWIVAPFALCEHPKATPGYGESLVSRLLEALANHPDIWSKTVFLINYDENDGLFDHVPPAIPAIRPELGQSNIDTRGEDYQGVPVGFGIRVPMLVVSPWSRGGWVNSQLFDHTSVIRFLERRFGVAEPNISPWRRSLAGDLTSTLDFTRRDAAWPRLPSTRDTIAQTNASCKLPKPLPPSRQSMPRQEPGQRPARALPYSFEVSLQTGPRGELQLLLDNRSTVGVALNAYTRDRTAGPWFYSAAAGTTLVVAWPQGPSGQPVPQLDIHGPNGFLRQFAMDPAAPHDQPELEMQVDSGAEEVVLTLRNPGQRTLTLQLYDHYQADAVHATSLAAEASIVRRLPLGTNYQWYDFSLRCEQLPGYLRRMAGHIETGKPSMSDPAIGRQPA